MAQYVFTMNRVGKIVPPKRQILKDISLSFFPGAKIGVLGAPYGMGRNALPEIRSEIKSGISTGCDRNRRRCRRSLRHGCRRNRLRDCRRSRPKSAPRGDEPR